MTIRLCACGCGGELVKPEGTSMSNFLRQRYLKGHQYGHQEFQSKRARSIKEAHARGDFAEGCAKRREKTLEARPLCKCGCGQPVGAARAMYARGCFDATTPENRARALAARDMENLKKDNSVRLATNIKKWKASGELDGIRRKGGIAKGMPDHLCAKVWIFRDPSGKTHRFSNLYEWARRNESLFEDDHPESKEPFWLRIARGLSGLLKTNGRSCSYKGWTAVSKLELEEGGEDLLRRTALIN